MEENEKHIFSSKEKHTSLKIKPHVSIEEELKNPVNEKVSTIAHPPEMKLRADNIDAEGKIVNNREYVSYVICESECHLCAKTTMSYVICESKCHLCAKIIQSKAFLQLRQLNIHTNMKHFKGEKHLNTESIREAEAAKALLALSEAVIPFIPSTEKEMEIDNPNSKKCKEGENLYPCKECDKAYTRRDVLRKHIRTKHIEVWPSRTVFNCTECEKVYGRQDCLRKHIRKKHLIPVNRKFEMFRCSQCKNTYSSRDKLTRHQIQHTAFDGKPFECAECQERFSRKDAMSRHMKSQHSLLP